MFGILQVTEASPLMSVYITGVESSDPVAAYNLEDGKKIEIDDLENKLNKGQFYHFRYCNVNRGGPVKSPLICFDKMRPRLIIDDMEFVIGTGKLKPLTTQPRTMLALEIDKTFYKHPNVFSLTRLATDMVSLMMVAPAVDYGYCRYTFETCGILSMLRSQVADGDMVCRYVTIALALHYGLKVYVDERFEKCVTVVDTDGNAWRLGGRVITAVALSSAATEIVSIEGAGELENPLNKLIASVLIYTQPDGLSKKEEKHRLKLVKIRNALFDN